MEAGPFERAHSANHYFGATSSRNITNNRESCLLPLARSLSSSITSTPSSSSSYDSDSDNNRRRYNNYTVVTRPTAAAAAATGALLSLSSVGSCHMRLARFRPPSISSPFQEAAVSMLKRRCQLRLCRFNTRAAAAFTSSSS